MRRCPYGARVLAFALPLLVVLAARPAAAQNTTGEVSGYVRDATGAPLPGATVIVTYPEIALVREATTNDRGYYILANVPNGIADLSVELPGFRKFVREGLTLELNARLRLDAELRVGQFEEVVEVKAQVPPVSTRADVAHLVTGEQTREIPIDGRTYMQLLNLVPGVSRNDSSYEFGTSLRADGQQINGLRKNLAALSLDGAENLDAGSNATQVNNVSVDAIEEFKVVTSQYAAEYGKAGGAQVNVVTKRGTRDFHGGGYGFLRSGAFDARNFQTGQNDALDFKNYGWTLGGPVSWRGFNPDRSRLFFFVGQEWKSLETQVGQTSTATVPSFLERQGNFSESPRRPVDPFTGQPFPGGIIPASRLNENGLDLAGRFPVPDASQRNTATLTPTQKRDIREDIVRFDVRTGKSSSVSLRYIRDTIGQIEPRGSFGGTSAFAQVPTSHDRLSESFVVTFTAPVGTRKLNELTISAVKNNQDLLQTGDLYQRDGLAITEIFPSNRQGRAPNITSLTGFTLGSGLLGVDYPTHIIGNYYTLKDNFTMIRGNHSFKTGVYLGHFRKAEEIRTPDAGAFAFADNRTGGSGVALADLLLGLYQQYTEADSAPFGNLRYDQVEAYIQDHWQLRPNLTVDVGVRYQVMPAPYERDDRIATFDPGRYDREAAPLLDSRGNLVPGTGQLENGMPTTGIAKAGVAGVPRGLYDTDWSNLAPRFGFTWDPRKDGKTAVRGGFGISYDRPVFNSTRDQASSPPFVRTLQVSNGGLDDPGGGLPGTTPPGGFDALATDFPMPTVYAWSLGVQRSLPWALSLDVNYVGNRAHNLLRVRELNYVTPSAASGVAPTPINNNRPYRGYARIFINETSARSDYHGLQLALNRRARGLSFGVAYTLSRSKGDADSEDSSSSGGLPQDPRIPGAEYAFQDFDRRHVLAVNYIYRLPFRRDQKGIAGHLLGGFQVSGITRFTTGRRLNVTAGTNTAIFGDQVTVRADLVPGQDPNAAPAGGRTEQQWLNAAAFARPATNQLGDLARNAVEGPSYFNTDLALFKSLRTFGVVKAQLRAECFNVFNARNYRTIETNLTNARFGQVTAYETQRIFQFGLKVMF